MRQTVQNESWVVRPRISANGFLAARRTGGRNCRRAALPGALSCAVAGLRRRRLSAASAALSPRDACAGSIVSVGRRGGVCGVRSVEQVGLCVAVAAPVTDRCYVLDGRLLQQPELDGFGLTPTTLTNDREGWKAAIRRGAEIRIYATKCIRNPRGLQASRATGTVRRSCETARALLASELPAMILSSRLAELDRGERGT
jgi:hypothetical protein